MATNNVSASIPIPAQPAAPPSPPQNATSPPNKRDLASWWKQFKRNTKKEEEKVVAPVGIFGVPLGVSIKYANVAISLTNEKGESYIYGYVPIVVAKCGVFLKEKATDVEGIFRLSGSAKRIKELQVVFDSPDRYGKGLDWTGYTVHDAANILRRYLNQLPQPIIPLGFYERARDPLRGNQAQAVGDAEAQAQATGDFDHEAAIFAYQKLITELPPLNRQLLLYILDLLAVFASKSEQNRMTSANLAAIFQPGLLSHPTHDMSPAEYRLSQDVLIFLIENQDHFLVGMSGTAADEKTMQEMQKGAPAQPSTPARGNRVALGRSASNASGGADSLRRAGGALRRNLSISSRNSKGSNTAPSPGSPALGSPLAAGGTTSSVQRSNTLPSQKSPQLASGRFTRHNGDSESAKATSPGLVIRPGPVANAADAPAEQEEPQVTSPTLTADRSPVLKSVPEPSPRLTNRDLLANDVLGLRPSDTGVTTTITSGSTPNKDRKSFFSKSPSSDTERKDGRFPNKLRKKSRTHTSSNNASAQSSTQSLSGRPESPTAHAARFDGAGSLPPIISNTDASPLEEQAPQLADIDKVSAFHVSQHGGSHTASPALGPAKSPVPSLHSGAEDSEAERAGRKRQSRWRLSSSNRAHADQPTASNPGSRLGSMAVAEKSETSITGIDKSKKTETFDSQQTATTDASGIPGAQVSSADSTPSKEKEVSEEKREKGPIGWFKAKVAHVKEEREERKAEKERARSPNPVRNEGSEHTTGEDVAQKTSTKSSGEPIVEA